MIGTRLSHYEIVAKIGEGGMGVVYKARDPRLDRFVAVKLLGPAVTTDADYRRRLAQEARAASALNHSGIVTIHDISTDGDQDFIVMEYVSGTTLEALMAGKRLPLRDALNYGVQAAQALAAAHAAGIIHRDLKPSNIMVTDSGVVKILDFGLAKLPQEVADASLAALARNETITGTALTRVGKIVGTVAYMSPEQAEGKKVDHRSDIFSLGTVLYEMATGVRPFQADSSISTLSAVLSREPKPPTELIKSLPRELERIILRCLRKEAAKRLQSAADLVIELEEVRTESSAHIAAAAAAPPRRRRRALLAAATAVVAAGALSAAWMLRRGPAILPAPVAGPLTSFPGDESSPALSPDGKQVAFAWNGEQRRNFDVYVMQVGSTTPLRLTSTTADEDLPVWSPDATRLAFIRTTGQAVGEAVANAPISGAVFQISALGGPERKLLDLQGSTTQMGWTSDGRYLVLDVTVASVKSEILKVSVSSSEVTSLLSKSIADGRYSLPTLSPDGRSLAFAFATGQQGPGSRLQLVSLDDSGNPQGEPRTLATEPTTLASLVWTADSSSLLYAELFSRQLWRQPVNGVAERFLTGAAAILPSISRTGDRLAYVRDDLRPDIWRSEPGGQAIAFASSSFADYDAQLSPDGSRIAFASGRTGDIAIWVANVDGSNAVRLTQESGKRPGSPRWSPDGLKIVYDTQLDDGHSRIFVIDAAGGRQRQLVNSAIKENDEALPSWSGDGQWIYFRSVASGRNEVWRVPSGGGTAVQLTRASGSAPWVSDDGRTLYYSRGSNPRRVLAMPVEGGPERVVLQDVVVWNYFPAPGGLYYMARSTDAQFRYEIRFLDNATGATRLVTSFEARTVFPGLSVSRDGKTIVHSAVPLSASADLMLVENFR